MIKVISLVGLSYTGKSTLAEGLVPRFEDAGIVADIIKKDEAIAAIGEERYGEHSKGGYSISSFLKNGQIPPFELHAHMNTQIEESLSQGHLVILEGGTRTRSAQAETLRGIDLDDESLPIFMLNLPLKEIVDRARRRRKKSGRYDDRLPIALAKLQGQYRGARSIDAPKIGDKNVYLLDAMLPTIELVDQVAKCVISSRA